MEDKQQAPTKKWKNGIVYLSILLLSTAAAACFMFSMKEPEADWTLVQYQVLMLRAPSTGGHQSDFAKSIVTSSVQNTAPSLPQDCHLLTSALLVTGDRIPASFTPDARLRMDFIPQIDARAAATDVIVYQPGLKSCHKLVLSDGETRYLQIPSIDNSADVGIYAAITARAVGSRPALAAVRAAVSKVPRTKN